MSAGASGEIVSVWDAINAYAAVWRHPEYTGVDRQKAVVTVGTAIDALVARKVEEERAFLRTIFVQVMRRHEKRGFPMDRGYDEILDAAISAAIRTPPPATRG